ncbi:MAG: Holliday junction resolvase RuvX [Balneolaceae bacterium]
MKEYGRLIGFDVGTKKIGVARTDLLQTIPNPVGTFAPDEIFDKLEVFVEKDRIITFVVGWPLTPVGEEGEATDMVEKFIKELVARFPNIPIVKVDERYTTKEAVKAMVEAGVPRMKRRDKRRVDRAAAALILQKYLDEAYNQ